MLSSKAAKPFAEMGQSRSFMCGVFQTGKPLQLLICMSVGACCSYPWVLLKSDPHKQDSGRMCHHEHSRTSGICSGPAEQNQSPTRYNIKEYNQDEQTFMHTGAKKKNDRSIYMLGHRKIALPKV